MMGTDIRDRATCQNLEEGTQMKFGILNDNRTKEPIVSSLTFKKEGENV